LQHAVHITRVADVPEAAAALGPRGENNERLAYPQERGRVGCGKERAVRVPAARLRGGHGIEEGKGKGEEGKGKGEEEEELLLLGVFKKKTFLDFLLALLLYQLIGRPMCYN